MIVLMNRFAMLRQLKTCRLRIQIDTLVKERLNSCLLNSWLNVTRRLQEENTVLRKQTFHSERLLMHSSNWFFSSFLKPNCLDVFVSLYWVHLWEGVGSICCCCCEGRKERGSACCLYCVNHTLYWTSQVGCLSEGTYEHKHIIHAYGKREKRICKLRWED